MDQKPVARYCPHRAVTVAPQVGFAQCIAEHRCFSDDPCPLAHEFSLRAAQAAKANLTSQTSTGNPIPVSDRR